MSESTTPTYSPGLEGVIAGESAICQVDPNAGLTYRGYDAHDLARLTSFEEVAWLLLHGELPTEAESEQIREELADERELPDQILSMLRLFPEAAHPIDAIRTGVSALGMFDPEQHDNSPAANQRKAIRLIAKIATLTTSFWRIRHGEEPYTPGNHLSYAGRFLFSLTGREPEPWRTTAFNAILVLYAEHDFNASTFAARVTASTMSDMYAALTSALGTLKGPLHGGANEDSLHVLEQIGTPDRADAWVADRLARHEKISGFGHRVYRTGDSRVPVMRDLARALAKRFGKEQTVAICEELEAVMSRRKGLCANVDLYAAPVFSMLDIPAHLNTPIFACARSAGWCAHVIEQHAHNRIIRPRSLYTGPARRPVPAR
ncbi:MAG TPA: citrate/2-methylcitrate synthase [Tepidisphaeraceae bacterium]|jgi:citrate synthase